MRGKVSIKSKLRVELRRFDVYRVRSSIPRTWKDRRCPYTRTYLPTVHSALFAACPSASSLSTQIFTSTVPVPRGLHSSTFQLNISAFCGIGGALRGCLGGVWEGAGNY